MTALRLMRTESDDDPADELQLTPEEAEAFNQYLDDNSSFESGVLAVGQAGFRASEILQNLDYNAYRVAYSAFLNARQEETVSLVTGSFPSPIAYWFHMFNFAFDSELHRFLYLRDTWEAVIRFVHALLLAELRLKRMSLRSISSRSFSVDGLFSDSMHKLIQNISHIINYAHGQCIPLQVATLLGSDFELQVKNLNRLRNSFSHDQTPPELQARQMSQESLEMLMPVFQSLSPISEMTLLRFLRLDDLDVVCEPFVGPTAAPMRQSIRVTLDVINEAYGQEPPYLRPAHMLVYWDGHFYCLAPFIHCRQTASRHGTQICLFKKVQKRQDLRVFEYEVLGESDKFDIADTEFTDHLSSLHLLFSPAEDQESTP